MRAIIRRPVGRHFTSNVSANSEFCFQLELLKSKSSFFIARCFGPLSVVSDRPITILLPHHCCHRHHRNNPCSHSRTRRCTLYVITLLPVRAIQATVISPGAGRGWWACICYLRPLSSLLITVKHTSYESMYHTNVSLSLSLFNTPIQSLPIPSFPSSINHQQQQHAPKHQNLPKPKPKPAQLATGHHTTTTHDSHSPP